MQHLVLAVGATITVCVFCVRARVRVYLQFSISLFNSVNCGYNDVLLVSNRSLKYVYADDKSDTNLLYMYCVQFIKSYIHKGFYLTVRRNVTV